MAEMAKPAGETIGERLLRIRRERRLTQRDIATAGVTAQYISRVERGERIPSVKALRKLAGNLGVTAHYLETGEEIPEVQLRALRIDDLELALRLGEPTGELEEDLRALLKDAVEGGDRRTATRARLALGEIAAHRGEHEKAVARLERAVAEPWVSPRTNQDAYITLAHSLGALERHEDAVSLLRACIVELGDEPEPASALTRLATCLSYALTDIGELEGAAEAIELAMRRRPESDDPYTRVRLHWSRARVASAAGDYELARLSINRAIGLLSETEDTTHLARAHLLAAEIALWSDDLDEANEQLATAAAILPDGASLEDRAFLTVQRAFYAARTGDAAVAMDYATAAIAMLGEHEDPAIRGAAHWALGEAYAAAGARDASRASFAQAGDLIPPGHRDSARLLRAWERANALADNA
jgi:transcriptional regulator with XRE-family HTH domain